MSTTSKASTPKAPDTRAQLRQLMSQHTAATYSKPATISPDPAPAAPSPVPARSLVQAPAARAPRSRFTVPLSPADVERLNALALEAHQRLGKRLSISEIFRIGLSRISPSAPITADELRTTRFLNGRRAQQGRGPQ